MVQLINSVSDALSSARSLHAEWNAELWWRGQSSLKYDLIPGVYRENKGTRSEQNLILRFRQYALTRHEKCPQNDDYCSWLFLAQHYGLPTRLLDWSESPLVSLFFAVESNPDKDANLFALNAREMNKIINNDSTLVPVSSAPARELFQGAFDDRVTVDKNVSILSHELDTRMLVQQSVFTLHGNATDLRNLEGLDNAIRTYKIPKESKSNIIYELSALGIRRRSLFPDLENLSKDLKNLKFS